MTDPDQFSHEHDDQDATNQGASSPAPAEGADDAPGGSDGSPEPA
ncbi:hypothetical protein [Sphingomonas sp. Mn802worker]|nr:hypothetical protein [Sphingomonas sp. Mn802worker]